MECNLGVISPQNVSLVCIFFLDQLRAAIQGLLLNNFKEITRDDFKHKSCPCRVSFSQRPEEVHVCPGSTEAHLLLAPVYFGSPV